MLFIKDYKERHIILMPISLFLIISGIKIILIASFSPNTYKVQNSNVGNRFGSHI